MTSTFPSGSLRFALVLALAGCSSEPRLTGAPPLAAPSAPPVPTFVAQRSNGVAPEAPVRAPELGTPAPAPPASAPPPPAAAVSEPGFANLDPSDDSIVAPPDVIPDCEARLAAAGVRFRPSKLPVHHEHGHVCGAPQVVTYLGGPAEIAYSAPPIVTCGLALALARFEALAQELATQRLGVRIARAEHLGSYSCRKMARFALVSEHSYANALDVSAFKLVDGRKVDVLRHFGDPAHDAATAEGRFLRELGQRAYDDRVFSVVVTRFFDPLHSNHLHLDLARYRTDGSR